MNTKRQPIVVVLGHVDHGKTSLLDAIRKTSVQKREAGGITQSIGASVVATKDGKNITFIDTPGHAAFSDMRSRGSKVADIALLIIDGSDGVKPQTKEAISLINEAKMPFLTVITKTDLPSASVDNCLAELEKEGIAFEGRGGNTPYIGVSAKKEEGLTDLLDLISLMAEVGEISSDPNGDLDAVVIETQKDKAGNSVSVVVRNGSIRIGDCLHTSDATAKVKGLFDDAGKRIDEVLPGYPVRILGFNCLPGVGSVVLKGIASDEVSIKRDLPKIEKGKIPVFLKASTTGSLEAFSASVPSEFCVVSQSVGDVTESDVLDAKANNAKIFVFESRIPSSVLKLAEMDKVKIIKSDIIYELINQFEEILKKGQIEILGKAEIVAVFPFDDKKIAGCKATLGRINKTDDLRVFRDEKELGKVKAISLKKQKQEVAGVGQGEEFGVLFTPQLAFDKGDVLVSVAK